MNEFIVADYKCKSCGWSIVTVCCNDGMSEPNTEWSNWDWWTYCSNKSCENHQGEGIFQDNPDWYEAK